MKTVIVLVTKSRLQLLRRTLDSLRECDLTDTALYVVDNGSDDGTVKYLHDTDLQFAPFHRLLLNGAEVPQWQKSFAIRQVLRDFVPRDHPEWQYFGWLDDDMVMQPDWLTCARRVLDMLPDVAVASMHQDDHQEQRHPTVRIQPLGDLKVRYKRSANGACWLVRRGFFNKFGPPKVDGWSVANSAKDDDTYNNRIKGKAWCREG